MMSCAQRAAGSKIGLGAKRFDRFQMMLPQTTATDHVQVVMPSKHSGAADKKKATDHFETDFYQVFAHLDVLG